MARPWDELVVIGRVARPHGLRGEVIVDAESADPASRFVEGLRLWVDDAERAPREWTVAGVKFLQGRPILALAGLTSREQAEELTGAELRVRAEALPPLPSGSYYVYELVGCEVRSMDGEALGTVSRVDGAGAASLLVVDGPRGELLIPLADRICRAVDVQARRIEVDPPEGLLDLNTPASNRRASRERAAEMARHAERAP